MVHRALARLLFLGPTVLLAAGLSASLQPALAAEAARPPRSTPTTTATTTSPPVTARPVTPPPVTAPPAAAGPTTGTACTPTSTPDGATVCEHRDVPNTKGTGVGSPGGAPPPTAAPGTTAVAAVSPSIVGGHWGYRLLILRDETGSPAVRNLLVQSANNLNNYFKAYGLSMQVWVWGGTGQGCPTGSPYQDLGNMIPVCGVTGQAGTGGIAWGGNLHNLRGGIKEPLAWGSSPRGTMLTTHEVLHVLGLAHNPDQASIMCGAPYVCRADINTTTITGDDLNALRQLYGHAQDDVFRNPRNLQYTA